MLGLLESKKKNKVRIPEQSFITIFEHFLLMQCLHDIAIKIPILTR